MPHERERDELDDRARFEHMLEAGRQAAQFVEGRSRADLDTDHMLRRALKDCIQEIGEAASRVSDAGRDRAPELPSPKMIGMRHILVHAYMDIDCDTIWKVATSDLTLLTQVIEAVLADWPETD